jgi:hypothetical protein
MKKITKAQAIKIIADSPGTLKIRGEKLGEQSGDTKHYQLGAAELAIELAAHFSEADKTGRELVIDLPHWGRAMVTNRQGEFYLVDLPQMKKSS